MIRIGGLFDPIWDRENLASAFWRAKRGKRQSRDLTEFMSNASENLNRISNQLRSGVYSFGAFEQFSVRDTKTRIIHAPRFQDRVVHHAMINVIGPVLERGALVHSYACRKGRGQHAAIRQASQWTKRMDWYGKIDIEKFYDNVDHDLLRQMLGRRFSESRLLRLFDRLLESYDTVPGKGIPIGALTSQYFGNFYLDEFDRQMKATGMVHRYLRYMDDIVLWSRPSQLAEIRSIANDRLYELKLQAKHNGEWNACRQGVPFLGFVIYPDRIRLNAGGRRRLRKKFRMLDRSHKLGKLNPLDYQSRLTSLFAHARFGDDIAWRNALIRQRDQPETKRSC